MRTAVQSILILAFAGSAFGDDFPIEHGRYRGMTSVLRLTAAQVTALSRSRELRLTRGQKAALAAATGRAPSRLHVYFTKDGENDHACTAYNVAMRFSDRELEVPHEYVVDDAEATRRQQEQATVDGALLEGSMAVVRMAVADEAVARRSLRTAGDRAGEESLSPGHSDPLAGVDEADVIALYVAASGKAWETPSGLPVFAQGHHGAWLRLPASMTASIARTAVTPGLLREVDALSSLLRREPKAAGVALDLATLRKIVATCQRANGRTVFLYVSE